MFTGTGATSTAGGGGHDAALMRRVPCRVSKVLREGNVVSREGSMMPWAAWLWIAPAITSCVGCALGVLTGDQSLVGKSLLVMAGTLSLARLGAVLPLFR